MFILTLIHVLLHHPALHLIPTPSIAELTLNLLQGTVFIEMALEEVTLLLTTLVGALQRILLALWQVITCDLLVGTFVAAVLASEGSFHTSFRFMFTQHAWLQYMQVNGRFPHSSDLCTSSERRWTCSSDLNGYATFTYSHFPSTDPTFICSSSSPSPPTHSQPSALLLQRTLGAITWSLKTGLSLVFNGWSLQRGHASPFRFRRSAAARERCWPQRLLWIRQELKRNGAEIILGRLLYEVVFQCRVVGCHLLAVGRHSTLAST